MLTLVEDTVVECMMPASGENAQLWAGGDGWGLGTNIFLCIVSTICFHNVVSFDSSAPSYSYYTNLPTSESEDNSVSTSHNSKLETSGVGVRVGGWTNLYIYMYT
jgi:hypothetical protein